MVFLEQAQPLRDSTCIDFGCGTGRGALMLALLGKLKVTMVDFAENALDDDIHDICRAQPDRIEFIQRDLNNPRYPSLKGIMASKKKKIDVMPAGDLGDPGNRESRVVGATG